MSSSILQYNTVSSIVLTWFDHFLAWAWARFASQTESRRGSSFQFSSPFPNQDYADGDYYFYYEDGDLSFVEVILYMIYGGLLTPTTVNVWLVALFTRYS